MNEKSKLELIAEDIVFPFIWLGFGFWGLGAIGLEWLRKKL